jgi:hypothetical protein
MSTGALPLTTRTTPPAIRRSARSDTLLPPWGRLVSVLVSMGMLGVLGLAAWLVPDPSGHGTHAQLGLVPCGWVLAFDKPCPTCGMTTSFAHAADGHFLDALHAQPLGALLAVGCAAVFWASLHAAITGAPLHRVASTMLKPTMLWGLAGAALLAWAYKLATWSGS